MATIAWTIVAGDPALRQADQAMVLKGGMVDAARSLDEVLERSGAMQRIWHTT